MINTDVIPLMISPVIISRLFRVSINKTPRLVLQLMKHAQSGVYSQNIVHDTTDKSKPDKNVCQALERYLYVWEKAYINLLKKEISGLEKLQYYYFTIFETYIRGLLDPGAHRYFCCIANRRSAINVHRYSFRLFHTMKKHR